MEKNILHLSHMYIYICIFSPVSLTDTKTKVWLYGCKKHF